MRYRYFFRNEHPGSSLKKVNQALVTLGAKKKHKLRVRYSEKVQFGDYQVDGIITEAKKLNISPREFAKQIVIHLNLFDIARKIEISDLGFINIFLNYSFLERNIDKALKSKFLNIKKPSPKTIVVDYSSPNVAKEMHVGHLRSTIVGDATVRTLEFLGHKVIRVNHIGDWGTQFGMLIAYLEKINQESNKNISLSDLEVFYRKAKKIFDKDKDFANRARSYVVKLQNDEKYFLQIWKRLVNITILQNQLVYKNLNVTLSQKDILGESFYNKMLPSIIRDLKKKKIAVEKDGATVVFLDTFKNKHGKSMGVIIQKKDGGYLYSSTDIACLKYRYEVLHADRILYYVDSRQHQHLTQVWTIARKAGYIPDSVSLEHHMLGMILDQNGKPFKTRSGNVIKIIDLLNEAKKRAKKLVIKKNPNISLDELENLAKVIGISSIKYSDLSKNRITNYIFNWNEILSFEGNTAPYIQYTYIRTFSLLKKSGIKGNLLSKFPITICENCEVKLAIYLLRFEEILYIIAQNGTPHVMCSYLHTLSSLFSYFYEKLPILSVENYKIRNSRIKLVQLTEKTLKIGLNILGIETLKHM